MEIKRLTKEEIQNILSADTVRKSSTERGNQVRNLSDPVTVTEEQISECPLCHSMRRREER